MFYKIFIILICGIVLSLFTSIAAINITSILLLIAIVLYIVKYPISINIIKEVIRENKIIILMLLFLPAYIFIHQLIYTKSIIKAFQALFEWRTLLYGSIFMLPFLLNFSLIKNVGLFFIRIASLFAIIGLTYFIFTGKPFNQEAYKHAPYLSSQILVTAIFACWQLALTSSKGKQKSIFYIFGIIGSLMLFFATTRRTGYIIYAIAFIVFILMNFKIIYYSIPKKYKLILAFIPLLICSLYFAPSTQIRIKEAVQENKMYDQGRFETSNGLRLRFWQISMIMIKKNPIFGVGSTNYSTKFVEEEKNFDNYNIKVDIVHPHNEFLHIWSCFGIFAFLAYISILFFPLVSYIKINAKLSINQYIKNDYNLISAHKILIIAYVSSVIGTLFNAMAIDMIEGHFLSLILAIYYSLYININININSKRKI